MFCKRLNKEINDIIFNSIFEEEFSEKNRQFFKGLDCQESVIFHVSAPDTYYSLISVKINDIYNSLPVSLFINWTGINPDEIEGINKLTREEFDLLLEEKEKKNAIQRTNDVIQESIIAAEICSEVAKILRYLTVKTGNWNENNKLYLYDQEDCRDFLYINREGLFCLKTDEHNAERISPESALNLIKEYIERQQNIENEKEKERKIIALWLSLAASTNLTISEWNKIDHMNWGKRSNGDTVVLDLE